MSAMSDLAIDIENLVREGKTDDEIVSVMVNEMSIPSEVADSWLKGVKGFMHYPDCREGGKR
jgi:hypothetical protein